MKEFNLSEKLFDCSCGCDYKDYVISKNNVKEFIKRLKEEISPMINNKDRHDFAAIINKIAGNKLV